MELTFKWVRHTGGPTGSVSMAGRKLMLHSRMVCVQCRVTLGTEEGTWGGGWDPDIKL